MRPPACYCHDPAVFGHQARCGLGLGPVDAGGHGRGVDGLGPPIAGIDYTAAYAKTAAAWWGSWLSKGQARRAASDFGFFCGCVAASGAGGWLWSLAEHFMRTDLHV